MRSVPGQVHTVNPATQSVTEQLSSVSQHRQNEEPIGDSSVGGPEEESWINDNGETESPGKDYGSVDSLRSLFSQTCCSAGVSKLAEIP